MEKIINYKKTIKSIRNKLVITQEELSKILGVSFASVNRWETGRFEPTTKLKRKILDLAVKNGVELKYGK